MNKICLFGGSFNPVTIAHEEIIKYLSINYDKVIILPNGNDYNFHDKSLISIKNRIDMLKIVCKNYNNVKISYYSIFHKFKGVYKVLNYYNHPTYVIGDDCIDTLTEWMNYKDLLKNNNFLVFDRGNNNDVYNKIINNPSLSLYVNHFNIVKNINIPNVSASMFREKFDKSVVSAEVFNYIESNNLYIKSVKSK